MGKKAKPDAAGCPCGLGGDYVVCCGRYLSEGGEPAPTAEALMRSRYTAYARGDEAYLLASWHPSTRPQALDLAADAGVVKWLGLEVLATEAGAEADTEGWVEFAARYKVSGKAERMRERSRFAREDGRWFYVSGELS
ncbi:YchJ family metal-binding protein [Chromobacterium sp. IRSSSOUMB001]|uniref:YchJ family protein n=1 Tax=Chromobacterium sp. IRSSSOUMB001 TaxID=2927123 RepID=UPI0020BEE104|nr:YchJ family metal-binding protein [Chromobacterium sp. IRSSSOUMB001]